MNIKMEINEPNNIDVNNILNDFTLVIDKETNDLPDTNNFNWLEKYHPDSLDKCLLKSDDKKNIETWLYNLKNYDPNNIKPSQKSKKKQSKSKKSDIPSNCLLLHGPPGIGKTTISKLIYKKFGYDILEFNASDTRTAKVLEDRLGKVSGSHNIVDFMCNKKTKIAVILDEMDGLSSGDKGGMGEINSIISQAQVNQTPFICITNSISKRMDSLKRKSLYIKLGKPNDIIIDKIINNIISEENISISPAIQKKIVTKGQGDIRRSITLLEYFFRNKHTIESPCEDYNSDQSDEIDQQDNVSEIDFETEIENYSRKFTELAPYEMAEKVLGSYENLDFFLKNFNYDNSMTNWYIFENFVKFIDKNRIGSFEKKCESIENIYSYFCQGDIVEKYIVMSQNNDLYTYANIFKTHSASYLSNKNLKKTSYNKMGMMNYSTLLNKTSLEYLNSKSWLNLNSQLQNNQDTNITSILYDIIWKHYEKEDYDYLEKIISKYKISIEEFEKILKGSCYYNKSDSATKMRKKIKMIYDQL